MLAERPESTVCINFPHPENSLDLRETGEHPGNISYSPECFTLSLCSTLFPVSASNSVWDYIRLPHASASLVIGESQICREGPPFLPQDRKDGVEGPNSQRVGLPLFTLIYWATAVAGWRLVEPGWRWVAHALPPG